jgi:hypothetical protein
MDLGDTHKVQINQRLFYVPFGFGIIDCLIFISRTRLKAFFEGVEDADSSGVKLVA